MSDQVTARQRRPISDDMFVDLLPDVSVEFDQFERGWVTVTFGRDLTGPETAAVTARLTSSDDADLADRAELAALAEAIGDMPATPVRDLVVRLAARILDT